MVDNSWILDVESKIFSMLKVKIQKDIGKKYPDLYITNSNKTKTDATYPTIYIHEMSGAESANDLKGDSINAYLSTFQFEVTTNTTQSEARTVMKSVLNHIKSMGFELVGTPYNDNTDTTYRCVVRCRRMIGSGDSF